MSVAAQLKSGLSVFNVLNPESFNWYSNLSRTEFLSNSLLFFPAGKVVAELDHISLPAFGKRIFL